VVVVLVGIGGVSSKGKVVVVLGSMFVLVVVGLFWLVLVVCG